MLPAKIFQPRKGGGNIALIDALPRLADLLLTPSADADSALYFASEIKALVEARAVAPEINYPAPLDYPANHAPRARDALQ